MLRAWQLHSLGRAIVASVATGKVSIASVARGSAKSLPAFPLWNFHPQDTSTSLDVHGPTDPYIASYVRFHSHTCPSSPPSPPPLATPALPPPDLTPVCNHLVSRNITRSSTQLPHLLYPQPTTPYHLLTTNSLPPTYSTPPPPTPTPTPTARFQSPETSPQACTHDAEPRISSGTPQQAPACARVAAGEKLRIAVALSGGVDSAVAALLLKQQGHDVFGVFMRNWDFQEEGGDPGGDEGLDSRHPIQSGGCHERDLRDARDVARTLDIPLHDVDFVRQYWDKVFSEFLIKYSFGTTPNPDLACNRYIKFGCLLETALSLGAQAVATGHYSQLASAGPEGVGVHLLRSVGHPDQSYFLAAVSQEVLRHYLFPVGHMVKSQVREIARKHGLLTADKRSSRGICFIGPRTFDKFMSEYVTPVPGSYMLLEVDGSTHCVAPCPDLLPLTVGQRVHISGRKESTRLYLAGKDMQRHLAYVVSGQDHPALAVRHVLLGPITWVSGMAPSSVGLGDVEYGAAHHEPIAAMLVPTSEAGNVSQARKALHHSPSVLTQANTVGGFGDGTSDSVSSIWQVSCEFKSSYRQPHVGRCTITSPPRSFRASCLHDFGPAWGQTRAVPVGVDHETRREGDCLPVSCITGYQASEITLMSGGVAVFSEPVYCIAPQQVIVLYDGPVVLGSAEMLLPGMSLFEEQFQKM